MKVNDFVTKLQSCKLTTKQTGSFYVKVKSNKSRTIQTIYRFDKCKTCGSTSEKGVFVKFGKSEHLTVFEAEMLFSIYILGKQPLDYGQYHKCQAGQDFINNIRRIEVVSI